MRLQPLALHSMGDTLRPQAADAGQGAQIAGTAYNQSWKARANKGMW